MAEFIARITEDIPANRLLTIVKLEEGIGIGLTTAGGQPEFRSTGPLSVDREVTVSIKGDAVWDIEAGEDLKVGANVVAGEGGVLVATEGASIGYVVKAAEKGEVATFIRRTAGGVGERGPQGAQGAKGNKGDKGDPGEVTRADLDQAINTLRTELSN